MLELPNHDQARLVTSTGEHPAIVIRQPSPASVYAGHIVDAIVAIGVLALIYTGKLSAGEGLPWLTLILGVKLKNAGSKSPPPAGAAGAIASMFTRI